MDEKIKKIFEDHEKRIRVLEDLFGDKEVQKSRKKMSIKEFILSKKPESDIQKTLVIGYYLENYEDLPSLNSTDLEDGFRSAKEKVPNNINLCVIRNISKGYMMEAKEKKDNLKSWNLTNSGERFVENGFKKE